MAHGNELKRLALASGLWIVLSYAAVAQDSIPKIPAADQIAEQAADAAKLMPEDKPQDQSKEDVSPDLEDNPDADAASDGQEEAEAKEQISLHDQLQAIATKFTSKSEMKTFLDDMLVEYASDSDEELYTKTNELLSDYAAVKEEENANSDVVKLYQELEAVLDGFQLPKPEKEVYRESLLPCQPTPTIKSDFPRPKIINRSGNLLRKAGSARRAKGQYIKIHGRVVDEQCVPIPDAVIQIWQNDHAGKNWKDYEQHSVWDKKDPDYDPNFAYSGSTQTNNLGNYMLLSIFPGTGSKSLAAPHINMRVLHPEFNTVETSMYFSAHPRNETDKGLQSINADETIGRPDLRPLVIAQGAPMDPSYQQEGRAYEFTIVLRGVSEYRQY